MKTSSNTFQVEDTFYITGRGLVLLGKVSGEVALGYKLIFEDATCWDIKGVESANLSSEHGKTALLVDAPFITREELLQRGILWNTAQIFAP